VVSFKVFGGFFLIINNLVFNNLSEIQVKFKVLYLYSSLSEEEKVLIQKVKPGLMKIFFKVLYLISLKEVLSGKLRNRLVFNYFKKIRYEYHTFSFLENNIFFLDSTYLSTLAISSIYSSFVTE
jgi:hypothetical protein